MTHQIAETGEGRFVSEKVLAEFVAATKRRSRQENAPSKSMERLGGHGITIRGDRSGPTEAQGISVVTARSSAEGDRAVSDGGRGT
ncbi:hypothetical protein JRG02_00310 [Kocuria indica]|uniref:hypothetical protein n=1 Tax=Kocuria marina TaxID=223184 RepID=UPI0019D314C7|nr:hypothetical protein [Kocuria indica]MBN6842390.1 hypothetical protein [Kocuria indica]